MESQQQYVPFIVFICNKKRAHEIFLKSKLQIMQLKISTSILGFKNYFLTYPALQTLVPPNLCLLLCLSQILNFQCFVLQQHKQIKHFKSLSKMCTNCQYREPGFRFYLAKLCSGDKHCTRTLIIKVPPLKVGVI